MSDQSTAVMKQSEQINELAAALSSAQGTLAHATKDSENPFFKSSYADLTSCWDACRGPLSQNKLSIAQAPELTMGDPAMVAVTTRLMHATGQWLEATISTPVNGKVDAQTIGSAITYLRRYSLCSLVGISPEEDDGNVASGKEQNGQRQQASAPRSPAPAATQRQPAASAQPAPAKAIPEAKRQYPPDNWRYHRIHFGKNKGAALGELEGNKLYGWYENWKPEPYNGKISKENSDLRSALDAAKAERESEKAPSGLSDEDKQSIIDAEAQQAQQDEQDQTVPF